MATPRKTFEQSLKELEIIVAKLERNDLKLDDALAYFGKGVKLLRACEGQLARAEGKLKELFKDENGDFVEKVLGITLESVTGGGELDE